MYCSHCGRLLQDGTKFCSGCGSPLNPQDKSAEMPPQAPQPAPELLAAPAAESVKKNHMPLWLALGGVLTIALVVGGIFGFLIIRKNLQYEAAMSDAVEAMELNRYSEAKRYYQDALSLRPDSDAAREGISEAEYSTVMQDAAKALEQGDYIKSQELCREALSLHPDAAEAKEKLEQAVMKQAEEYLQQEDFARAAEVLSGLKPEGTSSSYKRYNSLLSAARMDPSIVQVNVDSFPVISVTLSCGSEDLTADGISILDNGQERPLRDFKLEGGQLFLSYESDDAGYDSEHRDFTVSLSQDEFTFLRTSGYETPRFEPAAIKLISSDVSAYPLVRTYFRVERSSDGATVDALSMQSFRIYERLQGGEYLAREVRAVSPLESLGLNIDLVADKSSSISYYDMQRIKDVMIEFVNNLHYAVGDQAEVLAFDDIVQQMCCFTNDSSLLVNGINNMATDGLTAFYDAIYAGIRNASLQGGARCVIAFTDGMDNRSRYSAADVINYANTCQVPVYIIGVGNQVETGILQDIATCTGGRYWFINDLYDLQKIFDQIYAEQKELYMVEYISDSSAEPYAARELQVSVSGSGYKGDATASFIPAYSVQNLTHTSRYELVPGTCTWEEANQRCQEMGGHLATITSQAEMDQIIALAEQNNCKYIWLGGYTSYDEYGNVFGHWVTGENFSFQAWGKNQPSRRDLDGTPEWYIMLWYVRDMWSWNDQRNDPAAASNALQQNMCFVCEYED